MIRTDSKELCCGCRTCSIVCPKKCISFNKDLLGHFYSVVDEKECVHCGRCITVCPIQKNYDDYRIGKEAWVAYSLDKDVRTHGSSGGVYETFGKWIISAGGSAFACKFDKSLQLYCVEARTNEAVAQQTKSKYLQSECVEMFPLIRDRVQSGVPVLFCSTPCQVATLKLFLGSISERDNLYLVDFFCHGVPSQEFFDKCLGVVEKKNGIIINSYEFRAKIPRGVTPHYYKISYLKNGKKREKTRLYFKDPFYLGFQKYITLRESCYHCPYGNGNHSGDITIGDFHDVDKYIHGINRFDGVSTVLINTEKGKRLWELVHDTLYTEPIDIGLLYADKQIYAGGTSKPRQRNAFLKDLETQSFDFVVDKWLNSKKEWKKQIYYSLPPFVRLRIKKMAGL